MHRSRPALKLSRGPLALVLAQVRISPVLQMQTFIPQIQERLRNAAYPRYSEARLQEILFGPGAPASSGPTMTKWTFTDKEATKAVVIAPDFVTFEATTYESFDAFSKELRSLLGLLGEITEVALAERVGLRFVNHIRSTGDDRIEEYVAPGLSGIDFGQIGAERTGSVFVDQGTTAGGQYTVRFSRSSGPFTLPADLLPADVRIDALDEGGEYAVLDVDHFSTRTREYNPDVLGDVFWELHDVSEGIFREAVTPHALQVWGAREVREEVR